MLFHTKPDYSSLKAFGCLAYASLHHTDKFNPRAVQYVFLGYPHLTKGYRLLRLDTHAIIVSRHLNFFENIFPYLHTSSTKGHFQTTTSANSYDFLNWLQTTNSS